MIGNTTSRRTPDRATPPSPKQPGLPPGKPPLHSGAPTRRLRVRLGLAFGLMSALLAALLGWLANAALVHNAEVLGTRALEQVASRMANALDRGLRERARDVELLAFAMSADRVVDETDRRALLEQLRLQYPWYAWLGLANANGTVIAATDGVLQGVDVRGRPWYAGGMKGTFYGDVHEAKLLADRLKVPEELKPLRFVDVAAPVYDERGRAVGVLGAHLYQQWVRDLERDLLLPAERDAGIGVRVLEARGNVLISAGTHAVSDRGDGLVARARVERATEAGSGIRWQVEAYQPRAAALAPVRSAQILLVAAGAAMIAAFSALGWWLAGQLTSPILRLARAVDEVRAGNADLVPPPGTAPRDEVHALHEATADLVHELVAQRDDARRHSDERLRAEARLAAAVSAGAVGLWEWDPRRDEMHFSMNWLAQLGCGGDDDIGTFEQWRARLHPDDAPVTVDALHACVRHPGRTFEAEYRMRHGDGSWRWFLARAARAAHPSADEGLVIGSQVDITERKRSEQRFLSVVENMVEGLIVSELDGRLVYWNRAALDMHGFANMEECLRALPEAPGYFELTGMDGSEVPLDNWPLSRVLRGERLDGYEVHVLRRDAGWRRTFRYSGSLVREPDGNEIALLTLVDVTARRAAEEALERTGAHMRALIEQAPVSIAMFDRDMRYLAVSRRWVATVARGRDDLIGLCHYDVLPDIPDEWRRMHRRGLAGEYQENNEECWTHTDGTRQWMRGAVIPWRDPRGEIGGIMIFTEDVTERKLAEEARLRSGKLEALGTLARGIAHDFNNILLAINGYAALAETELPADHAARASLEKIGKAGARARDLVRRIVTFARQDDATRAAQPLQPVVEEAMRMLGSLLPATIALHLEAIPDCPPVVADASQIHQVIVNLVMNAWHAIGDRHGEITLRLDVVDVDASMEPRPPALTDGRHACITIRDTGEGMDAATLARIFDPFFTTKPAGLGTGLGLSVVHGIVAAHRGSITVESEPGRGTTFAMYFPAASAAPAPVPAAPEAPPRGRGQRIVYVDDEESLVYLVKRWLERLGYGVVDFTSARAALEWLHDPSNTCDALVSDVSMPGLSGLDLAREVLASRPALPMILTSGYVRPEEEALARQLGVRQVIPKPDTLSELAQALDRVLNSLERSTR